jgi:hypothetical protein
MSTLTSFFGSSKPAKQSPSTAELEALERCTAIVDAHVKNYARVGAALREIRDKQLFRWSHESFETFVKDRWKMGEAYAHRLIAAAEVAQNVSPVGVSPPSERVARPLTALEPVVQVEAWKEAVAEAGGGVPKVAQVERAVEKRKSKKGQKRRVKPVRIKTPGGIVIVEPGRNFISAIESLRDAIRKLEANDPVRAEAA